MAEETAVPMSRREASQAALAAFKLHLREVTPRLRVVPVLVALNVLVFAVMAASGASSVAPTSAALLRFGADYGPLTLGAEPWRLLTNVFVHIGFIHLLANMAALLSAGPTVERLYGPWAFAALYLAAGIAGSLLSVNAHPLIVSAGASGAIFGVYGALGVFVLRQRGAIPPLVVSRLGSWAGTFVAYNVLYGAAHAGIDNMAHLGGLLGGAAAAAFLVRPLAPNRPHAPREPLRVILAAVFVAAVVVMVAPKPVSFERLVTTYGGRLPILERYGELVKRMNAGKIGLPEFRTELDRDIRPAWHSMFARLRTDREAWQRQKASTPAQEDFVDLVDKLFAAREDGWARASAALAANDTAGFQQSLAESEAKVQAGIEQMDLLMQIVQASAK
jgi:rhomboid protease GluP